MPARGSPPTRSAQTHAQHNAADAPATAAQAHAHGPGHGAFLNDDDAATVAAFAERLMPGATGKPGAHDAGVLNYIDLALAGAYADLQEFYRRGLAALDAYSRNTNNASFVKLDAAAIGMNPPPGIRQWGAAYRDFFGKNFARHASVIGRVEDLPYAPALAGFARPRRAVKPQCRMAARRRRGPSDHQCCRDARHLQTLSERSSARFYKRTSTMLTEQRVNLHSQSSSNSSL